MAINRYGVQTESGHWHLVEEHTHLITNSLWKIITKKGEFFIHFLHGLDKSTKWDNIENIKQFIGTIIYFSKEEPGDSRQIKLELDMKSRKLGATSRVTQVIEFK